MSKILLLMIDRWVSEKRLAKRLHILLNKFKYNQILRKLLEQLRYSPYDIAIIQSLFDDHCRTKEVITKFVLLEYGLCKIQTDSDRVYVFLFGGVICNFHSIEEHSSLILGKNHIEIFDGIKYTKFSILNQVDNFTADEIHELSKNQNPLKRIFLPSASHYKLQLAGYFRDNHSARILKLYHLCDYLGRTIVKNFNFYFISYDSQNFHVAPLADSGWLTYFSVLITEYFFAILDTHNLTACFLHPPCRNEPARLQKHALAKCDENNNPLEFRLFEQRFFWDDFWLLRDDSVLSKYKATNLNVEFSHRAGIHEYVANRAFTWYPVISDEKPIERQLFPHRQTSMYSSHVYDEENRNWRRFLGR